MKNIILLYNILVNTVRGVNGKQLYMEFLILLF